MNPPRLWSLSRRHSPICGLPRQGLTRLHTDSDTKYPPLRQGFQVTELPVLSCCPVVLFCCCVLIPHYQVPGNIYYEVDTSMPARSSTTRTTLASLVLGGAGAALYVGARLRRKREARLAMPFDELRSPWQVYMSYLLAARLRGSSIALL